MPVTENGARHTRALASQMHTCARPEMLRLPAGTHRWPARAHVRAHYIHTAPATRFTRHSPLVCRSSLPPLLPRRHPFHYLKLRVHAMVSTEPPPAAWPHANTTPKSPAHQLTRTHARTHAPLPPPPPMAPSSSAAPSFNGHRQPTPGSPAMKAPLARHGSGGRWRRFPSPKTPASRSASRRRTLSAWGSLYPPAQLALPT